MESKIVELETLTPLFIKGKDLDYGEGMLRGSDGVVYLIDNDKLCEYIASKEKTEEYVNYFSGSDDADRHSFSIHDFLRQENISPDQAKIKELAYGVTQLSQGKKFVQNGKGANFIPGSSLKGAIRNAVLWKILSEPTKKTMFGSFIRYHMSLVEKMSNLSGLINVRRFEDAKAIINNDHVLRQVQLIQGGRLNVNKFKDFKKNYEEHLSKQQDSNQNTIESISFVEKIPRTKIEDSFKDECKKYLQEYNERWEKANDTLKDFFRIVKISDGNFIQDFELEGQTAKAVCKYTSGKPRRNYTYQKSFPINLECTSIAVKAHFKITIDTELAKAFFPNVVPGYLQSVDGLINVVDEFYREVARFEKDEFYDRSVSIPNDINPQDNRRSKLRVNTNEVLDLYKTTFGLGPDEILFRTGWGGGFMSKTQFLHLGMADRVQVRDMIRYNGSPLAPKSRCLIVEGEDATEPLGWCRLRVLGDAKDRPLPRIEKANIKTNILTEQPQGEKRKSQSWGKGKVHREKPLSEKEIKKIESESKSMLKQAQKYNNSSNKRKVRGIVTASNFLEKSLTININDRFFTITYNKLKQIGEHIDLEVIEEIDGIITKVKIDHEIRDSK